MKEKIERYVVPAIGYCGSLGSFGYSIYLFSNESIKAGVLTLGISAVFGLGAYNSNQQANLRIEKNNYLAQINRTTGAIRKLEEELTPRNDR